MKIVVCGPPHSGKSVFLGGLCENLPRDKRFLFRACPDGEGTWTWNAPSAAKHRRKGEFTEENVDWYVDSLRRCELAPIILVDVGGRMSSENQRIMAECDAAIILAGSQHAIPEWEAFCKKTGLEVFAVLHSDYNGPEDDTLSLPMVVHHLERGEDVSSRPAIQAVAAQILEIIPTEREEMEFLNFETGLLSIAGLATALGKSAIERTLPNGKVIQQIVWEGSDLPKIADLLHNRSAEMPEVVKIDGAAPAWLVAAIVHECHPRHCVLNSPDGFIAVGCRRPKGDGEGVEFSTTVRPDGRTIVQFRLDPSVPLAPKDLDNIAPPELAEGLGARIILSGRGPNWLMASLAMSYHGRAMAVACFQPGTGSTVSWTHSQEVKLGEIIPE